VQIANQDRTAASANLQNNAYSQRNHNIEEKSGIFKLGFWHYYLPLKK
jgi:hypothetical protein